MANEVKLFGWYSETTRERWKKDNESGYEWIPPRRQHLCVYESVDGGEVVVTEVTAGDSRPLFADSVSLGELGRWLRDVDP